MIKELGYIRDEASEEDSFLLSGFVKELGNETQLNDAEEGRRLMPALPGCNVRCSSVVAERRPLSKDRSACMQTQDGKY